MRGESVGEDFAAVFGHDAGEVFLGGCGCRGFRCGRGENFADLDYGDVVRDFLYGFDEGGGELAVVVLGAEADFSAVEVGDVDEAGGARGGAGGLVHCGGEGGAVGDLVELFGAEVVEEDVEGEDVFYGVDGGVLGEEVGHGGVVDGADGDGGLAVDLGGQVGQGQVVVEGRELRVLREDARDVVRVGGDEEKEQRRCQHCPEELHCGRFGRRERVCVSDLAATEESEVKSEGRETGEVLIRGMKEMGLGILDYYGLCHWREEQE